VRKAPARRSFTGGGPWPDQETVLETLVRLVKTRWWIILSSLIIVPAVALAFSLLQDKQYTATANLLFRETAGRLPDATDNNIVDPARVAATNEELVSLPVIADLASRRLNGAATSAEIQTSVTTQGSADSDVVVIEATSTSPELSARIANAYGDAYIEFRRDADRAQLQDGIELVRRNIEQLTPEQRAGAEGARLQSRLDQLTLAQSLQTGNAEVVQRADVPTSPSSPKTVRNVILGIIVGGLLGLGIAAAVDRLDRRLRTPEDLEAVYDLPVIARIPRARSLMVNRMPRLATTLHRGPEAEQFRMLRTNLRFVEGGEGIRSLLIASPMQGDGKSTVSRFLGATMADMGDRVLLVEADLHKSGSLGQNTDSEGLAAVLTGLQSLDDAIVQVPLDENFDGARSLSVLPSVISPPNPSEMLESRAMVDLLHELERRYDLVILDTPPLSVVSDGLSLVPEVGAVLVVSGLGKTTRDSARTLSRQLAMLGARTLGVVANFAPVDRRDYYYRKSR
jgi:receptor protein-tyrosine kinase